MILLRDFQGPLFNVGFFVSGDGLQPVKFIPHLLSTSVDQVTVFRGRENEINITLEHAGDLIDLTKFNRYQLFGLSDSAIDTNVNSGVISGDALGVLTLDVGPLATFTGGVNTTLVAYGADYPNGVVLWDKSLPRSSVSMLIVDTFTAETGAVPSLTNGIRFQIKSRTNNALLTSATGFNVHLIEKGVSLSGIDTDAQGYLIIQDESLDNIGESIGVAVSSSDGEMTGFMTATVEDLTTYLA